MNQVCKCAHPRAEHAGSAGTGKCRDSCGCGRFRAAEFVTPPVLEFRPDRIAAREAG